MSISQKIENNHKNRVECIKKMRNGIEKNMAIGALVADIGNRCLKPVAKAIGSSFRKVKQCYSDYKNGINCKSDKLKNRGRKKTSEIFPNLISDIETVIEKYKEVDSHFKTDTLFITIDPASIIEELVSKFDYPPEFACYNTIKKILNEMGYKLKRISKTKVLAKIPETDAIFENVNDAMESALETDNTTAAISIDDKATKKVGNISDNGRSYLNITALDHDTTFDYSMKPFGILDLKTNETFVTCTPYSSTAEFKVDCIEQYIIRKTETGELKKLIIFLDNGPENSGRRKLWLKSLVELAKKYNLVIELVYYPPYHSKYNKIERFWARLQIFWSKIIMYNVDILLDCLNKVTWNEEVCIGKINYKEYAKGITISDDYMDTYVNPHIIREEGLEKWSIVITPNAF